MVILLHPAAIILRLVRLAELLFLSKAGSVAGINVDLKLFNVILLLSSTLRHLLKPVRKCDLLLRVGLSQLTVSVGTLLDVLLAFDFGVAVRSSFKRLVAGRIYQVFCVACFWLIVVRRQKLISALVLRL